MAKAQMSDAEMAAIERTTAETLAAQSKVRIRLYQHPAGSVEKPLPDETVCVNGYIYQIKRGESVEVPETVADILSQAGRI